MISELAKICEYNFSPSGVNAIFPLVLQINPEAAIKSIALSTVGSSRICGAKRVSDQDHSSSSSRCSVDLVSQLPACIFFSEQRFSRPVTPTMRMTSEHFHKGLVSHGVNVFLWLKEKGLLRRSSKFI